MKKSIYVITMLLITFLSCSSDDDSNEEQQVTYNVEISGKYVAQWCIDPITSKVTIEFLENGNVNSTINAEGSNDETETFLKDLSGNNIGVRLILTDYNPNNLQEGEGDAFNDLHFKVTNNQTQEVLVNEDIPTWLVHCGDIYYEVTILFNASTSELEHETLVN
ncbi:hypothetical protein [Gaetbulibacter sp. NE]|uniref:hypothetical protein n=1 Tax=Gaetbulibacter sp. NE TaxID=2982307 RepID=UPI0021CF8C39|nr:hypothetical protein [Gaetbulibacter sp. NE]